MTAWAYLVTVLGELVLYVALLYLGVVLHEAAHAVATVAVGGKVRRIELFGGRVLLQRTVRGCTYRVGWIPLSGNVTGRLEVGPRIRLRVAAITVAGPAMNLAVGVVALLRLGFSPLGFALAASSSFLLLFGLSSSDDDSSDGDILRALIRGTYVVPVSTSSGGGTVTAAISARPRQLLLGVAVAAAMVGCSSPFPPSAPAGYVSAPTAPPVVRYTLAGCHVVDGRADTRCTPGVRNPQVTQSNVASTICRSGWTSTIRPPVSYTNAVKARDMPLYGETGAPSTVELDHLIPLELGGNPTDTGNLWPEPWNGSRGAHTKDAEETSLKRAVCGGRVKLTDAQAQILRDWTHT